MFGWKITGRGAKRMVDVTGAYDGGATGVMSGIIEGTRVATSQGWRDVGALQPGDRVLTFDGGLQTVAAVRRQPMWAGAGPCPSPFWPLAVPAGALENSKPMRVLPNQGIMLESDVAEDVLGDPFALVPAAALEGVHGIERAFPSDPVDVITLVFDTDQVVFAEHGALMFCPAAADLVLAATSETAVASEYQMLPSACASALVRGKMTTDSLRCLREMPAMMAA